jgi:hypothetical protein
VKFTERLLQDDSRACAPERVPGIKIGYRYPLAEEYLGKNARASLESLADKGLLEKEFHSRELSCPKCGSINLTLRLHCPKCDSQNISKRTMIEHVTCGYVGPEDEFKTQKCPKCGKPLKQIGVDHVKQGLMHSCRDCKHIFQTPVEKLKCANDETVFDKADVAELVLYSYKVTRALEEEVNRALNQRRYIAQKLETLGFKTVCPAIEKGKSGVQQQFYMIAMSGMGFLKVKVVIEILGGDTEISPNDLFSLYARATDVGAYGLLVAAIPGFSQDAKGVAETYGIAYVEAQDLQTAADGIVSKIGELVEAPEEKMMQVLAGPTWRKPGG